MKYYLGKGTEFKKEECKEYKTKDGALKALAKTEDGVVWDENGNPVGTGDAATVAELTGNVQESPQGNADMQQSGENENGAKNTSSEQNEGENKANTKQDEDVVIVPQGKMRVTVICDGSLNLRRSPAWGNENICGRAIRGQSYYVKEIHTVNGKKMVRTVGDIYLSGASEHVQFEQL